MVQSATLTFRTDPEFLIDSWDMEDGLPENSATAMVQTPDGYIWFGTFNGLVRFDGVKFTVFNPANTPGLPSAAIVNLHRSQNGRLWVSTDRGLVVLDGAQWHAFDTNQGWAGNYVRTFSERANGDLLLTTFDGHVLEFVSDRLKELPPPPGEPDQGYFGAVDKAGQWWVTQRRFVGHWDSQRWVQTQFPGPPLRDSAVPSLSARDGGVWVLYGKELLKFRQGAEVARVPLPKLSGGIWSLHEDSRTNVWICSYDSGIFRLDPGGDLQHWNTTNGLANLGCRFLFEDRERNLWVGTSGGGLARFKPRRLQDMGRASPLFKSPAKSVTPAGDGGMWVASFDKGLFHLEATSISHIAVPTLGAGYDKIYGLSVLEDRAGRVWYGEKDGCWWRHGDGSFEPVPLSWTVDDSVDALWEDATGRVWISSRRGVAIYDGNQFYEFGPEAGLPSGGVACFGEDHMGVIWLAAAQGVFRYEEGRFLEVHTGDAKSIRQILCFKAESDGTMWMGSRDSGLWRWRNGSISGIGPAAGLPVRSVRAILEDDLGFFWLPSDRGIVRAARQDLNAVADGAQAQLDCLLLDHHDGLPSTECSGGQPSCARDRTGRLWFATQRGVAMLDPAAFRINSLPPPVHIERLDYLSSRAGSQLGNHPTAGDSTSVPVRVVAPFPKPLRLPPGSYAMEIAYTAPTFSSPEKARFQTRLDGSHRDWEDAKGQRSVRFHQLPPGDYEFHVRAANDDGVWNETGANLAFTVEPFFWQTVWFRVVEALLIMGCGGGGVWWLVRARLRRALEREQMTRQLRESEERLKLAAEAAGFGVWIWNLAGNQVWGSEAWRRLFGFDREEVVVIAAVLQRIHPEDRQRLERTVRSAMAGGDQLAGEYRVAMPDGTARWIASRGRLDSDANGKPARLLGVAMDITARKAAEQEIHQQRNQLAHLSRVNMLGELAGSLAHELNQPLTAILSNAQAAQRFLAHAQPDLAELSDILTDIVAENKRAGEVIHRLRLLLKKGEVQLQLLTLNDLIQDVLKLVRSDLVNQGVSAQTELSPNLPDLHADRVGLQQVLINLLINSCDAMAQTAREDRRLTIRSGRTEHDSVIVSVTDCGPGIAPDKLEEVFEPFYTTKPNGLGLGLSVCRTIITAHGGKLWATNDSERGATVHFTLPLAGAKSGRQPEAAATPTGLPAQRDDGHPIPLNG